MRRKSLIQIATAAVLSCAIVTGCAHTDRERRVRHLQDAVERLQSDLARQSQMLHDVADHLAVLESQPRSQPSEAIAREEALAVRLPDGLTVHRVTPPGQRQTEYSDRAAPAPTIVRISNEDEPEKLAVVPVPNAPKVAKRSDTYRSGLDAYRKGKFVQARRQLESFLAHHPDASRAANARYWIAESLYEESKHRPAATAYQELLNRHPKSHLVPAAMFKLGVAHAKLGHVATSKDLFVRLVREYPKSAQSELARARLED